MYRNTDVQKKKKWNPEPELEDEDDDRDEKGEGVSIYIVEISCQLLNVLLQLIRCLQAILEETGEQRYMWVSLIGINMRNWSVIYENCFTNVSCFNMLFLATKKVTQREIGAVYV